MWTVQWMEEACNSRSPWGARESNRYMMVVTYLDLTGGRGLEGSGLI